eukprot:m.37304 g.37304  ORF g.37304 m.37304 type:complete len:299 (+) comp12491_c0_seq1:63-959(+)
MAKLICVGDTHGNLSRLNSLLDQLEKHLGTETFQQSHLLFCGDYVDRGFNTKGVLQRIIDLCAIRANTYVIAGNHDFAMAAFLGLLPHDYSHLRQQYHSRYDERLWGSDAFARDVDFQLDDNDRKAATTMHVFGLRWGATLPDGKDSVFNSAATFASYGVSFGDRQGLLAAMPESHKAFLRDLPWLQELTLDFGKVIAVHAGLHDGNVERQLQTLRDKDADRVWIDQLTGRWDVVDVPEELIGQDITVVSGHHGFLSVASQRVIVDESAGNPGTPIAAVILPGKDVVRDAIAAGVMAK